MLVRRVRLFLLGLGVSCAWVASAAPKWVKASTPELTILSASGEKLAVARAKEFLQYIATLRAFFGTGDVPLPPLTMVLFPSERDFSRYRPLGADGKPQPVGGYFGQYESWAVIGVPSGYDDEVRRTLYHEGVHWYLAATARWLPAWLDEGTAEVLSTLEVTPDAARWGRELRPHVAYLGRHGFVPLRRLVMTGRDELFVGHGGATTQFYAQSWAFVHYLMFGDHSLPPTAIQDYAAAVKGGGDPDEAFRQAFGGTYEQLDQQLARYINGGKYFVRRRALAAVSAPKVTPATAQELDDALGRLALLAGRPTLAADHARAMIQRRADDARGHTLLGLAHKDAKDEDAARAEFELAVRYGAPDFHPYFELASMIQHDGTAAGATLGPAEARRAADLYIRALEKHPALEASYSNLAGVIGAAEPVVARDREALLQGAERFPNNLSVQLGLAQLERAAHERQAARERLDRVLARLPPGTGTVANFARKIDASWADEDFVERTNQLARQKNYVAALAAIDARLQGEEGLLRGQLTALRKQLQVARWIQELNEALETQEWSEARSAIARLLAADAGPSVENEARRILAELDERGAK